MLTLSSRTAQVRLAQPVATLGNLMLSFTGRDGAAVPGALYAKVIGALPDSPGVFVLRFSSMSPEIEALLRRCRTKGRSHENAGVPVSSPDGS